jgi:hypothetical protein
LRSRIEAGAIIAAPEVTNDACWIANDHSVVGYRLRYYRTGADHGTLANRYARQDCRPPPDRSTGFNGRLRKRWWILFAARKKIVSEGHVGTDENIVFNAQSIPELHPRFHCDAITHDDIIFDENMGADVAVGSDAGIAEDDDKLPYSCVTSYVYCLHVGQRAYLKCHGDFLLFKLEFDLMHLWLPIASSD